MFTKTFMVKHKRTGNENVLVKTVKILLYSPLIKIPLLNVTCKESGSSFHSRITVVHI